MKKGFTLIELLVVIAIIGVLAVMSLVSVTGARGRAEDARRKSDLTQMMTAIELHRSLEGTTPGSGTCGENSIIGNSNEICGGSIFKSANKPYYIKVLPKDPKGGNYGYTSNSNSYTMTAVLDNGNDYICSNTSCYEQ